MMMMLDLVLAMMMLLSEMPRMVMRVAGDGAAVGVPTTDEQPSNPKP
jgi:hypothetical protein